VEPSCSPTLSEDRVLSGRKPREALGKILRFIQFITEDSSITIEEAVAASEQRTGFRNVALANDMKSFGVLGHPVEQVTTPCQKFAQRSLQIPYASHRHLLVY
jgi:glutaminase